MANSLTTAISQVYPDRILVRGYNLVELATTHSFGDVVYLLLTGELPRGREGQLIEVLLVMCAEHSINAPSVHAARTVASCGVPMQTAIAAGISAVGEHHGGAGEQCAKLLQDAVGEHPDLTPDVLAEQLVREFRERGERLPGFGHRVHNPDPRAERLMALADEWHISGAHIALARAIVAVLGASGRALPLNIDGALAAVLSDMQIDWRYGKAIFIIGRSAGLAAHVHEEMTTNKPLKFIPPAEIQYIGAAERPLP